MYGIDPVVRSRTSYSPGGPGGRPSGVLVRRVGFREIPGTGGNSGDTEIPIKKHQLAGGVNRLRVSFSSWMTVPSSPINRKVTSGSGRVASIANSPKAYFPAIP